MGSRRGSASSGRTVDGERRFPNGAQPGDRATPDGVRRSDAAGAGRDRLVAGVER